LKLQEVRENSGRVLKALSGLVVGKDKPLRQILAGILAGGHVLIEDFPGLAKTMIARLLGQTLGLQFRRIQFTPDLLPGDITGSFIFDQRTSDFAFREGPIFTQLLLADEINRATPKTQAALLEAMQEGQVTVEGRTFDMDRPFLVLATQNPIDLEGTYPLPEAQLDRFIMRIAIGYPTAEEETRILRERRQRRVEQPRLETLIGPQDLLAMQNAMEDVFVDDSIESYIVALAQATRTDRRVALGVSPRASLALLKLSRAGAALRGRDFVTPDDVKEFAPPAFCHRMSLRPELWATKVSTHDIVLDLLSRLPVPAVRAA
jgi:MoxR-like ATPase